MTVGAEVELEEEKVKVLWRPARLEAWLDVHSTNIGLSVGKKFNLDEQTKEMFFGLIWLSLVWFGLYI